MQPLNILRFLQSTENYCIVKSMRIYLVSLTVHVYKNNKLGFDACNAAKKNYRLKILQRQITETFKKKNLLRMADGGQTRWYLLHTTLN